MNNSQKQKELIDLWLKKAAESLESAKSEFAAGRLAFTVNRLYYSIFYLATAALTAKGEKLGKHSAVRAAFHRDFVRTGEVDKSYGRLYDELFHARHQGDYAPMTEFEESVVKEELRDVERFFALFSARIKKMIGE
ncbi:MAG: HEPN domain-containing protein [Bacillota bacterium]